MISGDTIKIRLYAHDQGILDLWAQNITERAKNTRAKISGPFPLPTERAYFTVNRSPHVDKKSREHFEQIIYKRYLVIYESNPQTIEALTRLDLPAGVDVNLKIVKNTSEVKKEDNENE